MPPATEVKPNDKLMRTLVWGVEKARKTSWALMCAKAGFNVVLLDGDDGSIIVDQLPLTREEKARIQIIDLTMRADKSIFVQFMAMLLRSNSVFTWDEQRKAAASAFPDKSHSHYRLDLKKFTPNDVVVADSWKALAESSLFTYADEKDLDLSDPDRAEWNLQGSFGYQGNFLNFVLARLHAFPCHVIVIGHATVYEKWDRRDKKNPKLLEQRTQIISSSGPHAKGVGSHFHDLFYFDRLSSETVMIDTGGDRDRMGGSRLWAPQKKKWEEFLPALSFEKLGAKATDEPCLGAQWFPPGAEIPIGLSGFTQTKSAAPAAGNGSQGAVSVAQPSATAPVIGNNGGLKGLQLRGLGKPKT